MLLKRGAEAELHAVEWHGRPAVEKRRIPKPYRHPDLDGQLRAARVRTEARLMADARSLGVPVPVIYDIDTGGAKVTMARIPGPTLKEVLDSGDPKAEELCRHLGHLVGILHAADIVHGDLTTSNVIVDGPRLVLIDFGLGGRAASLEEKGVDLHLLREAFQGAHAARMDLFKAVLDGYAATYQGSGEVQTKVKAIEGRARYVRGS